MTAAFVHQLRAEIMANAEHSANPIVPDSVEITCIRNPATGDYLVKATYIKAGETMRRTFGWGTRILADLLDWDKRRDWIQSEFPRQWADPIC